MQAAKAGQNGANVEAATILVTRVRPAEKVWRDKVSQMVALEMQMNKSAYERTKGGQRPALSASLFLLVGAALVGIVVGWRITRGVTRPIGDAIAVAERIAEGDPSRKWLRRSG